MRARFTTTVLVALSALAVGALTIAAGLAVSDADKWPGWLRPYHRWGWPAVWVLLAAFIALTVWQYTHPPSPPAGGASPTVHGEDSGPVAAGNVTISGGPGPTAGRDAHTAIGGTGPTAGRDIITTITNVTAPVAGPVHSPVGDQRAAAGPIANLSARNRAFTGRAELLDQLHQQLTATPAVPAAVAVTALPTDPSTTVAADRDASPQVLHGLGGVGKSQLALEYAHRHARDYAVRWWVVAEQPAAIPGQLAALARRLGIPEQADQAETVTMLLDELGRRGDWLLVFDNAEDPHDLHSYWPSTDQGGHLLVTSRNPNWQPLAAPIPVDVLSREDAITFLHRRVALDKADADRLAQVLGDLPLALEQAAAYLEQTHLPPGEYLELLATRTRDLFALGRPATSEQTIATIWSVSLQRLRAQTPGAEELLRLCAFLAPDDIPRTLLHNHPDVLPEPLAAVRDRLAFQQALVALGRYSLVTITGDALRVHRLVQSVVRHQLDPDHEQQWTAVALRLVRAALPDQHANPNAWPAYARLLPHVLAVTDHAQALGTEPELAASLLNEVGSYLRQRADYQQARASFERALAISEARLGADHLRTAISLHNLGTVLRAQGDLDGARTLHERALAIHESCLGPDHLRTAQSLHNLGTVLRAQGDLDGARTLHERALAIHETRLGADQPRTGISLNNLAQVLYAQGDLDGARTLFERALAIFEARLGPNHPTTAIGLSNLGAVLRAQGDLDGARTLHERALAIRQASVDPDHPDTAWSLNNLAWVLRDQGDLDGARTLFERALAIFEARLGPNHPTTAIGLSNLSAVLRAQGDLDGARTLLERALAIREARLGTDHLDTAWSLRYLARVLRDQGDLDRASTLHQRALAIREARLGPDHPDTQRSREDLAAVVAVLENRE